MKQGEWITLVRDADSLNQDANWCGWQEVLDGESEVHWVAGQKVYEERRGIKVWVLPTG